ncbi:glycoside hydrolase family 2 protein [Aquibacillus saliphilus]|uniref:glycoside hydrolase family 2 protein n=1 Tax=Aquibacillus saliphilus TaxID=1909422 RepID=UPI001CF0D14E|nr:sugar-binding domain-containing protein [Aquibacillus saliphilus]
MRKKQNLNGTWKFQTDRKDIGEKYCWFTNGLQESIEVEVPHIWQKEEEFIHYCGVAWYERFFTVDELPSDKRAILYFGAVDFHASVWINGEYIGDHEGGFTPFEFDITNQSIKGKLNRLSVRVYDPKDNAEIPIGKQGSWYTRVSGIWQDVYLEYRSECYIDHVHIEPNIDEKAVDAKVLIAGEWRDQLKVEYVISNHLDSQKINGVHHALVSECVQSTLPITDMRLWSPDSPHLYDLQVTIKNGDEIIDSYKTYFGMRKVTFDEGKIQLNDKPLYVRGALDQAFYPDTLYYAPSDQWIRDEINAAKKMGFNLLRKHIKVEIPRYLYWADRMGMLIWQEPPNVVKWSHQSNRRFYSELLAMIRRDYNHPSIIIWSLYNEEWGLEWDLANDLEKQKHVKEMYDSVKTLDSTRLICDNSGWTHVKTDINDYHSYFSLPEQVNEWKNELSNYMIDTPEKNYVEGYQPNDEPIIVSEFGVWGLPSVQKLVDYFEGYPSWFENLGDDTHKEDFKKPLTIFENFKKYQLDTVFHDIENLSEHSQKRMFRACQSLIEEMRKKPEINGYVVTEFTDIEWETNGWLDYTRDVKAGFEHAFIFNGDLVVMADPTKHNMWCGEEQAWDVIISNHDMKRLYGTLEWKISNTDISGSINIDEGDKLHVKLPEAIRFVVPNVDDSSFYKLEMRLVLNDEIAARNEVEMTISPRKEVTPIKVYAGPMNSEFKANLKNSGYNLTDKLTEAEVVVTNTLNTSIVEYYRTGGHVLFLAEEGDKLVEKGQFTFRELDQGESWDRTSSLNYVDTSYFSGVPLNKEMGWEFENLYPDYVVPFSDYNKMGGTVGRVVYMFGNDTIPETSQIVSGYFQGWAGQVGGSTLVQSNAKGSLTVTTWKLIDTYTKHPIATQLVNNFIERANKQATLAETDSCKQYN